VKVRSITLFAPFAAEPVAADLKPYAALGNAVRAGLVEAGFSVLTIRLALPPWPRWISPMGSERVIRVARQVEDLARKAGVDYV